MEERKKVKIAYQSNSMVQSLFQIYVKVLSLITKPREATVNFTDCIELSHPRNENKRSYLRTQQLLRGMACRACFSLPGFRDLEDQWFPWLKDFREESENICFFVLSQMIFTIRTMSGQGSRSGCVSEQGNGGCDREFSEGK